MRKRIFVILLSVIISAILLVLVLRDVPLEQVWESMQQADIGWLITGFAFVTGALFTRGARWRGLLGFQIPLPASIHLMNIAFLMNLLPMRIGEVVRSALATRYGVPFMTGFTSVIVERLFDSLIAVLLLAFAVSGVPNLPQGVTQGANLFGLVAAFGFIVLITFAHRPTLAHNLLGLSFRFLPFLRRLPLKQFADHVLDGLHPLTNWKQFGHFVLWTLIAWSMSLISFYCLYRALPIGEVDLIIGIPLGISLTSFSIALPATVAAIGPFEAAMRVTGDVIGMNEVVATALGLLIHGLTALSYCVWGIVGLIGLGVSPGEMIKSRRAEIPGAQTTIIGKT